MSLLGKVTRDTLGGMVPGAALGAGAGALAGAGQPGYQQAESAAMGMGLGALAGGAAGSLKSAAAAIFQAIKRQKPEISDMQAWAMAEAHAHDMAMAQRGNPPISGKSPLLLE